jgi:hypothetical protein
MPVIPAVLEAQMEKLHKMRLYLKKKKKAR